MVMVIEGSGESRIRVVGGAACQGRLVLLGFGHCCRGWWQGSR